MYGDIDEEETEGAEEVVDVQEGALDVVEGGGLGGGLFMVVRDAESGNVGLTGGEKFASGWRRRHEKITQDGDANGDQAFEEEDVAPAEMGWISIEWDGWFDIDSHTCE